MSKKHIYSEKALLLRRLRACHNQLHRYYNQDYPIYGFSDHVNRAEFHVLMMLHPDWLPTYSGKRTIPEIARQLDRTRQGVHQIIEGLLEKGFVTLKDNPDHKKSKIVELAGDAVDLVEGAIVGIKILANERAEQLDLADLLVTVRTLEKLASMSIFYDKKEIEKLTQSET